MRGRDYIRLGSERGGTWVDLRLIRAWWPEGPEGLSMVLLDGGDRIGVDATPIQVGQAIFDHYTHRQSSASLAEWQAKGKAI